MSADNFTSSTGSDGDAFGDLIVFNSQEAGETFVRTLRDHRAWCPWCLVPLEVSPTVQFTAEGPKTPIWTARTFAEHGTPLEDVPPDRTDEQGVVVEHSRDKQTICGNCGVVDVEEQHSRSKETTQHALRHLCSILEENDVDVDLFEATKAVDEAFAKGHTGQFVETLGAAIYRATDSQ